MIFWFMSLKSIIYPYSPADVSGFGALFISVNGLLSPLTESSVQGFQGSNESLVFF